MRKNKAKLTPLSRRLSIYQIFRFCRKVSFQEITDQMPSLSHDTISKDIKLLIEAGVLKTEFLRGKKENVYIKIKTDITRLVKQNRPHVEKISKGSIGFAL